MKFLLNMIVKNESGRITRALDSVAPFISGWVICDTGSTDDTKEKVKEYFNHHKIPGILIEERFIDWAQARNAALNWGRSYARQSGIDYLILMDADMEIVINDLLRFTAAVTGDSVDMYQQAGSVHYQNRRLVHADTSGEYRGVTHEYLDIASSCCIPSTVAYFIDHADGANRPEKFKRDIQLLLKGLEDEPDNARYYFYLAQSYRDSGDHHAAAIWYRKRVEAGGWDEEVWQAQVNYAHCLKDMKDEGGFLRELLVGYNMRPTRAEPLYDLARHYRDKGMNAPAVAFAETGLSIPLSTDALFVNDYVYKVGLKEELSICSFYVPSKRRLGYEVSNELALHQGPYHGSRELAKNNLFFYLEPLKNLCPSFEWQKIDFTPPEGWVAMNPSITTYHGVLLCLVRCVNYRINEHGQYLIKATDGTSNNENPINTRNFIIKLDDKLHRKSQNREIVPPPDLPCAFPLVVGFEDMRIFSHHGNLWGSSTVRQIHPDGNCEQVLVRLLYDQVAKIYRTGNLHRMLRQPRTTEKNWAPILAQQDDPVRFMWRPGEVVNRDGATIHRADLGIDVGHISGSSQVIPWRGNYLAITHEARPMPGTHLRHYYHRFVKYDSTFSKATFSLPFYFNDQGIEFCAGLCYHPNGDDLIISYGHRDESARLATVSNSDVEKFLCSTRKS